MVNGYEKIESLHDALKRLHDSVSRLHDAIRESLWISILIWVAFLFFVISIVLKGG